MMLQELYYEQHVERKKPPMDTLIRVLIIAMTALTFLAFAILVNLYVFVPFALFALLALWYFRESRKEFDYILKNGELEVSVIRGGNSRKALFHVDLRTQLVVIAPSRTEPVQPWVGKRMKTWDCTSHTGMPYYCMIMKDDYGREYKALFEPDETLLSLLVQLNPEKVHRNV